MTQPPHVPDVGTQDPELKNSPIAEEMSEEGEDLRREVPGEPVCYFNSESYPNGDYVRSGSDLLRCDYGIWISAGPSDLDNP